MLDLIGCIFASILYVNLYGYRLTKRNIEGELNKLSTRLWAFLLGVFLLAIWILYLLAVL